LENYGQLRAGPSQQIRIESILMYCITIKSQLLLSIYFIQLPTRMFMNTSGA